MFKRLRWITAGAVLGAASSWWAQRKAKDVASRYTSRYTPAGIARSIPQRLSTALTEGRATMRQREAELRSTLGKPEPVPETPATLSHNGHK